MSLNRRVGLVHEIQDLPSEEDLVELLCSMLDTHSYTQVTSIGSFLKVKFPLLSWSKYSVSGLTSFLEKYSKYFEINFYLSYSRKIGSFKRKVYFC